MTRHPPLQRDRGLTPLKMVVIGDREGKPHVSGIPTNPEMAKLLFEVITIAEQRLGVPKGTAHIVPEGGIGVWVINIPPCLVLEMGDSAIGGGLGVGVQLWSPDRDQLPYRMRDRLPWWRTIRAPAHMGEVLDIAIEYRDWFRQNPDWLRMDLHALK